MIALWGLSNERPLIRVKHELDRLGERVKVIDQWEAVSMEVELSLDLGLAGRIRTGDSTIDIEDVTALYARPHDWRQVVAAQQITPDSAAWRHVREVEDALYAWWEVASGIVVNSPAAMASNASKPYQSNLIRAAGLAVPSTLVTTDPEEAKAFWRRHGRVVYKSISSVRSCVSCLEGDAAARLEHVAACPTQFQQYIPGTDVRVHVIGDTLFATEILTEGTDYRYEDGTVTELRPLTLPVDLAAKCRLLTTRLGLWMAGIDFRTTPDGCWYCLEVNPSPGFTYYESRTRQPMGAATARLLAGDFGRPPPPIAPSLVDVVAELNAPSGPHQVFIRPEERPAVGQATIHGFAGIPATGGTPVD